MATELRQITLQFGGLDHTHVPPLNSPLFVEPKSDGKARSTHIDGQLVAAE